ncbi:response regulator [Nonomuraea pusilla]|uniref:Two component transcriptional regulator, LuxR family n=1 Tax=Nonomuraea pusilla TaxID=46177 RepID=A0A1H8JLF0_9ACTN|nr:response regulator transcription factor [Nonomuraea pusilla]SEN81594.1 two component transcriptional regulator, LuxR family [Nonomuraea pusilla]
MLRVLVADDQDLFRAAFGLILGAQPDMQVVGEAADGDEAIALARRLSPDVVLMDVRMPGKNGIEATREICATTRAKVLVLTMFDLDEYVYDAVRAGASGFLLKDIRRDELAHAVRTVAGGEALLAPAATRRLLENLVRRPAYGPMPRLAGRLEALTERERETLTLVARGLSNAEIAAALVVTEHTVKTHVSHILTKLDLRDRVQAVVFAYECGLVVAGESDIADHTRD